MLLQLNINSISIALKTFVCFWFLFILFSKPAFSQSESVSLGVAPAIIEQVLDIGSSKIFSVYVYNPSKYPLPIKAFVNSLEVFEKTNPGINWVFNTSSWISIEPSAFILKPNERKMIKIASKIPSNASPGGHYATLFFEPLIEQKQFQNSTVKLGSRVGVLVYLIIKGEIVKKIRLTGFNAPFIKQPGLIDFEISLRNEGNVHLMPYGSLDIYNFRNQLIERIPLPSGSILPGTTKEIKLTFNQKKMIGRFWVQPEIYFGDFHDFLSHEKKYFWIVPTNHILLFLLLTLIVIYLTINRRKIIKAIKIILKKTND